MLALDHPDQSVLPIGDCVECGNPFTGHLNHIDPLLASMCFDCAGDVIKSITDADCWDCALREVECRC